VEPSVGQLVEKVRQQHADATPHQLTQDGRNARPRDASPWRPITVGPFSPVVNATNARSRGSELAITSISALPWMVLLDAITCKRSCFPFLKEGVRCCRGSGSPSRLLSDPVPGALHERSPLRQSRRSHWQPQVLYHFKRDMVHTVGRTDRVLTHGRSFRQKRVVEAKAPRSRRLNGCGICRFDENDEPTSMQLGEDRLTGFQANRAKYTSKTRPERIPPLKVFLFLRVGRFISPLVSRSFDKDIPDILLCWRYLRYL
jgi:hypothetical protein